MSDSQLGVIIASIVGLIGSYIIARTIHHRNKALLRQQQKIDSAVLIGKLYEPWRKNDEFGKLLLDINDDKIKEYDDYKIERFLNTMDRIATFWADGTLMDLHVKSLFNANLKSIRTDQYIIECMEKLRRDNKDTFSYLVKLLEKSKEWT